MIHSIAAVIARSFAFVPSGKAMRRMAIATAISTWVLLLVGCMVHGTGSSLACPDWPTCYGTFFPEMKNGVEYEHTHRVVATAIGIMTLVLGWMAWKRRKLEGGRTTMKLSMLAIGMVVFQGVLGGVTVLLQLPLAVTMAHLTTSMCFFCLLSWIALRSSPKVASEVPRGLARLRPIAVVVAFATLGQIFLGGIVRHTHNGLACDKIPLCDGNELWPAALGKRIQMGHRIFAVVLAIAIVALAVTVWRRASGSPRHRTLAVAAVVLVLGQIVLGLVSVAYFLPLFPVTAHLGVAALILVTHVALVAELPRAPAAVKSRSISRAASDGEPAYASGGE